ncbi:MAG: DNA polymerase III subunit gamma/tau [Desulfovibrionales bacterium]
MKYSHLTTKYRPQTFADVAGQDSVRTILSRAAETGAIAPAYLFSGTRGVGKTTLARILAKAVNCENGPAKEPCNVCSRCRQITRGAAVDVVEIDGASNRGIEQARRLKEDIGFAPLECRYKVIIIDEAHMLTREAFNAMLKTLEEPPGHATFIMATTEPHKFPPTIISRCQHFAFKRLTQARLEEHLTAILQKEGVEFEPAALRLLAARGAGSVRDSMSLLGQVLALGGDVLTEADVREVLGLAGHETMVRVVGAIADADCAGLITTVEDLLRQGLDLGFFLRELATVWRNLFLLKQCGAKGSEVVELPREQSEAWLAWSHRFTAAHIHACLQMTLEGQRRVLSSLEPAQGLELLLLNLAYLPQLMPVGAVAPGAQAVDSKTGSTPPPSQAAPGGTEAPPEAPVQGKKNSENQLNRDTAGIRQAETGEKPRDWASFLAFVSDNNGNSGTSFFGLSRAEGVLEGQTLVIRVASRVLFDELNAPEKKRVLEGYAASFYGPGTTLEIAPPKDGPPLTMQELKEKAAGDPFLSRVMEEFGAQIVDIRPGSDRSS